MLPRPSACLSVILCYFISSFTTSQSKVLPQKGNDALFLTPFIESGELELGRQAAHVKPIVEGIESYAGFFTVNKTCDSNLFLWYFPAEISPETAPVIVWLQGGPGASSLFGLFEENGAFYFEKDGTLKRRKYYWSQVLNVIYIDNPVGTGFSFTEREECYAQDQIRIGKELFSTIQQFFKLFPNLYDNSFFISGESYAGKYVPAFAYTIHENNKKNISSINLKGIAIGNGFSDPETMMNYGDYFYQIGIIDSNERQVFLEKQNEIVQNIKQENYIKAKETLDELILGDLNPYPTYFYNHTGFSTYYNFLQDKENSPYGDMEVYIQKEAMRSAIHVGNLTFNSGKTVEKFLSEDLMKSVKPWIEVLLEEYRVLIYNGQLDLIVPYPLTLNFLQSLKWSGADLYKTARRKQWRVGSDLAGYSKTVKNFTEVLVRDAGHMVPGDQPLWALDLITRLTFNKSF